jgi:alpha-beta hydrolase superfamily lysophospholipase
VREVSEPDLIQRGDAVLDVRQIARWAGCIGNRTTVVPIRDAKHDVFLSVPEARRAAFAELDSWLNWYGIASKSGRENSGTATQLE